MRDTDTDDLFKRAAPVCPRCGAPVNHVRDAHEQNEHGGFFPVQFLVCPDGHQKQVDPLP